MVKNIYNYLVEGTKKELEEIEELMNYNSDKTLSNSRDLFEKYFVVIPTSADGLEGTQRYHGYRWFIRKEYSPLNEEEYRKELFRHFPHTNPKLVCFQAGIEFVE